VSVASCQPPFYGPCGPLDLDRTESLVLGSVCPSGLVILSLLVFCLVT